MKTLIICYSRGNTRKIAGAMAAVLKAEVAEVTEALAGSLSGYELVGFGSGIYYSHHHHKLLKFVEGLPRVSNIKAFIFSTSGMGGVRFHRYLKGMLLAKGYNIVGEFGCKGFDTFGLFKIFGGINKGRPNQKDLQAAEKFAHSLGNDSYQDNNG